MISYHGYLLYCGLYAIAIAVPGPGVVAIVAQHFGPAFVQPYRRWPGLLWVTGR
jgi:threonine/homoserine/homoserine lactone efflux protein